MTNEHPVTTTDESMRTGQAQFLWYHGHTHPNPTGTMLVVDPTFVPDELAKELLAPGDDGKCRAALTDQSFRCYQRDNSRFAIRPGTDVNLNGGATCAFCGLSTHREATAWTWEGSVVCLSCAWNELTDGSRITPELVAEVTSRSSWPALCEWVMRIFEMEGR